MLVGLCSCASYHNDGKLPENAMGKVLCQPQLGYFVIKATVEDFKYSNGQVELVVAKCQGPPITISPSMHKEKYPPEYKAKGMAVERGKTYLFAVIAPDITQPFADDPLMKQGVDKTQVYGPYHGLNLSMETHMIYPIDIEMIEPFKGGPFFTKDKNSPDNGVNNLDKESKKIINEANTYLLPTD